MKTKIGELLCWLGRHKWVAIESTIKRINKYQIEADIVCERNPEHKAHGVQDNYW